jgi:hypothetical protein
MIVVCLHRISRNERNTNEHNFQKQIGMSISLTDFRNRITELRTEEQANFLLTIDDGHRDILNLVPLAHEFNLKPIVFMTGRQLRGEDKALPLTALYAWCSRNQRDPNKLIEDMGFDRLSLCSLAH